MSNSYRGTALIIHGAYGSPDDNWFPWLSHELKKLGYFVIVPSFPTPYKQNLFEWTNVLKPYLDKLDQKSLLIGHSIGAVFLLSLLEKLDKPVETAVFVSGFLRNLGNVRFDKINRSFYEKQFNWQTIRSNFQHAFVFHGENDPYVPTVEAKKLAEKLGVTVRLIQNGGHLNTKAGFVEFPDLLETCIKFDTRKALILPYNSEKKIFIQDRYGHKEPDWGFFGGSIEDHESPLDAIIRETEEELSLCITQDNLQYLGANAIDWDGTRILRYFYLYPTDRSSFKVKEGRGGHWYTYEESQKLLDAKDKLDEIMRLIQS